MLSTPEKQTFLSFPLSLALLPPPFHERMTRWGVVVVGGWTDKTKREETAPDLAAGKFPTSIVLLFGLRVWTKQDSNYLQMKSYVHPKNPARSGKSAFKIGRAFCCTVTCVFARTGHSSLYSVWRDPTFQSFGTSPNCFVKCVGASRREGTAK